MERDMMKLDKKGNRRLACQHHPFTIVVSFDFESDPLKMLRPSLSVPIFGISLILFLLISSSLSVNETEKEKEKEDGETAAKLNEANLEKVEAKVTKREAKEAKGAEKAKKKLKKPKGGTRETRDVFVAADGVGERRTQKVTNKDENGPSPPISSPNRRFKRGKMLRYAAAGGIVGLGLGLAAGK